MRIQLLVLACFVAFVVGCSSGPSRDATVLIDSDFSAEETEQVIQGFEQWSAYQALGFHWKFLRESHVTIGSVDPAWHSNTIFVYRMSRIDECPRGESHDGPWTRGLAGTWTFEGLSVAYTCVNEAVPQPHPAQTMAHEVGHAYGLHHQPDSDVSVMTQPSSSPVTAEDAIRLAEAQ